MTGRNRQLRRGFTLIELIVVMMLMTTLLAIAAPRLDNFMAGRTVNEETRRLVSLTHLARSEAIARNERMELWINPSSGSYGLRTADAASDQDEAPREYKLADRLSFELPANEALNDHGEAVAVFWPDGSIDDESFAQFTLLQSQAPQRTIQLSDNRLEYVSQTASAG